MELAEFITLTLTEISAGVKNANQKIRDLTESKDATAIFLMRPGSQQESGAGIEFDVAVTTKSNGSGTGSAKVKLSVFEAELTGGGGGEKENVSRVKFRVTVNQWHG